MISQRILVVDDEQAFRAIMEKPFALDEFVRVVRKLTESRP